MFSKQFILSSLIALLPVLLHGAIVLSNTSLAVCGAPGGC